jgi:hypothetical protein
MPELTYCIACSLDNFIAHHDDSHDGFCFDKTALTLTDQKIYENGVAILHDQIVRSK